MRAYQPELIKFFLFARWNIMHCPIVLAMKNPTLIYAISTVVKFSALDQRVCKGCIRQLLESPSCSSTEYSYNLCMYRVNEVKTVVHMVLAGNGIVGSFISIREASQHWRT